MELDFKDPTERENSLSVSTESKAKSSLRLKYETESQIIRQKLGGLEAVRKDLGLSKRKMSQLLMVDPSAWTRWTSKDGKTPPYIYRALQWYMALIEKQPEWHPQNSFLGNSDQRLYRLEKKLLAQIDQLKTENHQLENLLKSQQRKQNLRLLLGFAFLSLSLLVALFVI